MVLLRDSLDNKKEVVSSGDTKKEEVFKGASIITGSPKMKWFSKNSVLLIS